MATGRPPKWKSIPADQVQALAQLGCPATEIGAFFGVSHDTITRRFASEIRKGDVNCKIKLRKAQQAAAEGGNVAMLIFLGKNRLGQSDKVTYESNEPAPERIVIRRTDNLEVLNPTQVNGDGATNGHA